MKEEANKKKSKRWLLWIFLPILTLLIGAGTYAAYIANTAKNVVDSSQYELESRAIHKKSELRKKMVNPRVDNISILFLGVDENDGSFKNARTDSMILATFNEKEKSIKMVSIPRDSRVELVGRDRMDKITHAHAYGGLDMAVQTVEKLLDVPVDYYARLNFEAFVSIVDNLGGVEIDVPFPIREQNSSRELNTIKLEKGVQRLNGEEALAYARTRKYDNDIERGKRQQEVLQAIIKESISIRSVTKYRAVLESIGDNLKTNMAFDDMTAFHDYAYLASEVDIDSLTLSGEDATLNGIFYYILDESSVSEVSETLRSHLELEGTDKEDETRVD
jgi:LCP family protein required for cell wall assembly